MPAQHHGAAAVVLQLAEQPGLVAVLWRCSSSSQLASSSHALLHGQGTVCCSGLRGEHELAKRKSEKFKGCQRKFSFFHFFLIVSIELLAFS